MALALRWARPGWSSADDGAARTHWQPCAAPRSRRCCRRGLQRRGRGRGFGVHKALDQTGALLGPPRRARDRRPGRRGQARRCSSSWAVALGVLAWMHRHVGDPKPGPAAAAAHLEALLAPSTCMPSRSPPSG
jgi:hypothetical protein